MLLDALENLVCGKRYVELATNISLAHKKFLNFTILMHIGALKLSDFRQASLWKAFFLFCHIEIRHFSIFTHVTLTYMRFYWCAVMVYSRFASQTT